MSSFDIEGIDLAIKEVENYRKTLGKKVDLYCRKVAKDIEINATAGFMRATVDDDGKHITFTHSTKKIKKGHYRVSFEGDEIAFVEFGAGVYKNGSEPYPEPRPEGISKIGTYGEGRGSRKKWYFPTGEMKDGKPVYQETHGTLAQMPLYLAKKKTLSNLKKIEREVFK